jgi:hypothetical protein
MKISEGCTLEATMSAASRFVVRDLVSAVTVPADICLKKNVTKKERTAGVRRGGSTMSGS